MEGSRRGTGSIVTSKVPSPKLSKMRTLRIERRPPRTVRTGFLAGCVEVLSGFKLLRESSERMVGALMRNRSGKNGLYYLKLIESENRLRR
jgi:hypothetical protein